MIKEVSKFNLNKIITRNPLPVDASAQRKAVEAAGAAAQVCGGGAEEEFGARP